MQDEGKAKEELIAELKEARRRLTDMETTEAECRQAKDELRKHREHLEELLEERSSALRESEERFRTIFDNATDGILLADIETKSFHLANKTFCKMLGYSEEEVKNLGVMDIHPEEELPYVVEQFEKQSRGKIELAKDIPVKRKDGSVFYADINSAPVTLEDGLYLMGIFRDITERKQADEQLRLTQQHLRILAAEVSLAEERERRQIAADLHDNVGTMLAFIKLRLAELQESASSENIRQQAEEIHGHMGEAIRAARLLMFDISSPTLYELGLEAAVEELAEEFQKRHNLMVHFETDGRPKPLDESSQVVLFRTARECLVNVVKHAQASDVSVSIRRDDGNIQISIEDNGIGFNTSKMNSWASKRNGLGLFNMRERLMFLGGQLEIESQIGRGTKVILSAPLSPGRESQKEEVT